MFHKHFLLQKKKNREGKPWFWQKQDEKKTLEMKNLLNVNRAPTLISFFLNQINQAKIAKLTINVFEI